MQYDPPDDPKEYIHRVGRTARGMDGQGKSKPFGYTVLSQSVSQSVNQSVSLPDSKLLTSELEKENRTK